MSLTKAGCGEAVDTQETGFVSMLLRAETWLVDGDQLVITGEGQRAVLQAADRSPIVGVWALDELNDQAPVDTPVAASVTFALDGRLKDGWFGGYTGCDSLGGSYQSDQDQLSVTAALVIRNGCGEAATDTQAGDFVAVLAGAHAWTVAGEQLTITGDGGAAVFERGR